MCIISPLSYILSTIYLYSTHGEVYYMCNQCLSPLKLLVPV